MDFPAMFIDPLGHTSCSGATALISATAQQKLAGMPTPFVDVSCHDSTSAN